jgi:hypothetical protein
MQTIDVLDTFEGWMYGVQFAGAGQVQQRTSCGTPVCSAFCVSAAALGYLACSRSASCCRLCSTETLLTPRFSAAFESTLPQKCLDNWTEHTQSGSAASETQHALCTASWTALSSTGQREFPGPTLVPYDHLVVSGKKITYQLQKLLVCGSEQPAVVRCLSILAGCLRQYR